MVYTRCSKNDYDRFAEIAGDDSWSYDNILPYAYKVNMHSACTSMPWLII